MDADRSNAVFVESEKMELKSKFTDAVCKEIVAFLNADGGDLVIGVNDDGTVAGINNLDETSKKVSDLITIRLSLFLILLLRWKPYISKINLF